MVLYITCYYCVFLCFSYSSFLYYYVFVFFLKLLHGAYLNPWVYWVFPPMLPPVPSGEVGEWEATWCLVASWGWRTTHWQLKCCGLSLESFLLRAGWGSLETKSSLSPKCLPVCSRFRASGILWQFYQTQIFLWLFPLTLYLLAKRTVEKCTFHSNVFYSLSSHLLSSFLNCIIQTSTSLLHKADEYFPEKLSTHTISHPSFNAGIWTSKGEP